jgi:hypothetical protein
MKKQSFIGVVVMGALLVVFAGISQAGGWMHKTSGVERPVNQAADTAIPEFEEGEFGGTVETGTLPSSDASSNSSGIDADPAWSEEYDRDHGSMEPFLLEETQPD